MKLLGGGDLSLTSKFDLLPVKTRRYIDVRTSRLLVLWDFRHFGEVTVGGRKVGSTSGLDFLVQGEIVRSTWLLLINFSKLTVIEFFAPRGLRPQAWRVRFKTHIQIRTEMCLLLSYLIELVLNTRSA